ncbi:MAG TPA: methyltransferase domain-containing protein, partial [Spirochaetota bacterium]|nr:methyltransferase domain-containing protein [Spirochaetota bacterium]
NALSSCTKAGFKNLINCNNENLPFKDSSIDIIISWGSLHYCDKDNMIKMLSQIHRVLKRGGRLLATLRKDSDTYLKKGKHIQNNTWITELGDLKGSVVSFFSQEELKSLFKIFNNVQYGWMERTLIGDVDKVIAHWVISAEK